MCIFAWRSPLKKRGSRFFMNILRQILSEVGVSFPSSPFFLCRPLGQAVLFGKSFETVSRKCPEGKLHLSPLSSPRKRGTRAPCDTLRVSRPFREPRSCLLPWAPAFAGVTDPGAEVTEIGARMTGKAVKGDNNA